MAVTIKGFASDWSVPDPAKAALSATYAHHAEVVPASAGPLGNRWVFLGDSITQGSTQNSANMQGKSFPLWTQMLSGGRIYLARNAGIGGNTSGQMLARFDTDVTPYTPQVVFLLAGTNDIGASVTLETYQANIEAIRQKCNSIGAQLVLSTITPADEAYRKQPIVHWNHWLRLYASRNGLPLVDFYTALLDEAAATMHADLRSDAVHPNGAGYKLMGQKVADELAPLTRVWRMPLVADAGDTAVNGFPSNPILLADSNADGAPDGWVVYGGSSGYAHALVDSPGVAGKMAQVTQTANTSIRVFQRTVETSRWSVGDRVLFGAVINSSGGLESQLKVRFPGSSSGGDAVAALFTDAVDEGAVSMEVVVPTGATSVIYEFIVGSGTGAVAFGQPTFLNLTKLGLI